MKTHSLALLTCYCSFITAGCRKDMQDQPKYKPLGENRFLADGRDSRPIPAGTIARDELNANDPEQTGDAGRGIPRNDPLLAVDMRLLGGAGPI